MVDMKDFRLWVKASKCYEQLKALDDMNNTELRD